MDAQPAPACQYCHQAEDQPHLSGCPYFVEETHQKGEPTRRVRLRYSFEIDVDVPAEWDDDMIAFHRAGGSSWCANNAIHELLRAYPDTEAGCACDVFS